MPESRSKSLPQEILLGNGAVARGIIEAGCHVLTSYPGTPSSEIIPEVVRFKKELGLSIYVEWSTNEKVAFDNAYAAALTGKRAACCMKQVGLNVASDSLLSAAYLGTLGGLVVIACDDPGPHSSQTEQDSRLFAHFAKVPVFDPSSPREAREMVKDAFLLSERYCIPVMLRPALRVCHAKQNVPLEPVEKVERIARFKKDPTRWAATPHFRFLLHRELNEKLGKIALELETWEQYNFALFPKKKSGTVRGGKPPERARYPLGILAGGVPCATVLDILKEEGRQAEIPLLRIGVPFPFPLGLVGRFAAGCKKVLILEEPDTLLELLFPLGGKAMGRRTGHVPSEGELSPERVYSILHSVLKEAGRRGLSDAPATQRDESALKLVPPLRRPTLCPGCPHRASFYAIKKVFPKGIFTSDIGCYTLGLNLGAVDTVLDMGAGITMASGFYQAFRQDGTDIPIVATMGDSTFFHSGTASLLNAVYNNARFILVVLDNSTTAMTGMQPTPASGITADGSPGVAVSLEEAVKGCGVKFLRIHDPYDLPGFMDLLREARKETLRKEGGIAVIIARHPCLVHNRKAREEGRKGVRVTEKCTGCRVCIKTFECPALLFHEVEKKVSLDERICAECGVCAFACPQGAIEVSEKGQ